MSRWPVAAILAGLLAAASGAQKNPDPQLPPDEDAPAKTAPAQPPNRPAPPSSQSNGSQSKDDLPPDEDASSAAQQKVSFNPVQSNKDLMVGNEYFKKGNYKAASARFRSATQYNDANATAWLRLAEADEKQDFTKEAHDAYERYLQLSPTAKNSAEIRKRLEKLK
jgi:tetratricopeptide (TPR) repeat protein